MEIYELTTFGSQLAHDPRAPNTPGWRVVRFLNRARSASGEKIIEFVPDATPTLLMKLRRNGIIRGTSGVAI